MKWETIAEFSFIGGVLLAILMGTLPGDMSGSYSLLMILGVIVGFVNIFDKEIDKFMNALNTILITTLVFYILSALSQDPMLLFFEKLSLAIALFVGPVAFVISVIDVYEIAMNYQKEKARGAKSAKRKK